MGSVPDEREGPTSLPEGVRLRRSGVITTLAGWLSGMSGPAAAVTLGRTIVLRPGVEPSARLLRHELAHVRQWRSQPLTFPLRYLVGHLRYGYRDNPYEIEARAAEERDRGRGSLEMKA